MAFKSLLTATMAASSLLASSTFAVDLGSKTNLAVYYGQGPYQERLAHFCQQSSLDIIPISFVHIFPDQGAGGYPGSNFGNQCSSEVYENEDGVPTELYKDCHQIAEDIPICQAAGKTVLLSLGGATSAYKLDSSKSARDFADFLWGAFGPKTASWGDKPRPFGDAVINGFDFDIEHNGDFGYATMVNRLRSRYREDPGKKYYISAAPQCPPDDKQLAVPIMTSYFDFIFVQFYNTYYCSARSWVTNPRRSEFSFDEWVKVIKRSPNPSARIYIGLAASVNATYDDNYYLSPLEVLPLAATFMTKHPKNFGGIMLWEATYSENNQINGKSYADHMKKILYELSPPPPMTSTSKISSTTSKISSTSISTWTTSTSTWT
ncbi:chitinase, partial [[Emmonsia] crescens]